MQHRALRGPVLWVRGFSPSSARQVGSPLPPHAIACRLIACPGCGARSSMTATSS